MKRSYNDRKVAYREWKRHHNYHVTSNISASKICDKQIGHFRKKDAWDCGNTRCYICHGEKLLGFKKRDEKKSDLSFKEDLKDLK